jgi:hypothetical protein
MACGEKEPSVNQSPEIRSITIEPEDPTTQTELQCIATAQDADNDPIDLIYHWEHIDGTELGEGRDLLLTPSLVQPTDEIRCVVEASDGTASIQSSTSVVVVNSNPEIDSVDLDSDVAYVDSTLQCMFEAVDADLEELTSSIQWTVSGALLTTGTEISLDPTMISKSDELRCEVTIEDGYGGLATAETSILIQNTSPTLESVSITPTEPTTQDVLTCIPNNPFDIDGDEIEFQYSWSIDGIEQSDNTPEVSGIEVGQNVQCTVVPTDGEDNGEAKSNSVVVLNTSPVISSIEITPDVDVQADTILQCSVAASDVDGDALTMTYEWTTTTQTLGTQDTLELTPSDVAVGDSVTCSVTVTDVHGGSVQDSTTVLVDNTMPDFSTLPNISGTALSNETLTCAGDVVDLNDGPLQPSYSWMLTDGTVLGTSDNLMIDPNVTDVGDEIVCTMTAMDVQGETVSASTSIVVMNTAPEVNGIVLSDSSVYTNGSIEVTTTLIDADVDQVLSANVEWHVVDASGVDSIVQSGAGSILDGQYFSKGSQVYAVVTPYDGVDYGTSQTSGFVDVLNTVPSAVSLTLSPVNPMLDVDDVVCTVSMPSVDLDGDSIEYVFEWQDASGQIIQTTQTASLTDTLSSALNSIPQSISCHVTPFDGEDYGSSVEESVAVEFDCNCPQTTDRDFAFTYWPENFRHANFNLNGFYTERYFVTGYYGAIIDMSNGSVLNLAEISNLSLEEAGVSEESWLLSGLSSEVLYSVTVNGVTYLATDFLNSDETGNHSANNPSMLMDMGRFQQHIEIPEVLYQSNTDLLGSLSIVSSPQHLVLTHRITSSIGYSGSITVQATLSGDLWTQSQIAVLDGTRAVEVTDPDGVHWAVIAPEPTDSIVQASDGSIEVSRTVPSLSAGDEIKIPVLILPMDQIDSAQVMMYLDPENTVQVTYAQMNQSDALTTSVQTAAWNWERAAFAVPLGSIQGSGASQNSANWSNGTDFNIYNRHQLIIEHSSSDSLHVPLFLDGPINTTFNITGGAPLFRDANEEPMGLPIQVSKNWHMPGYWPNWFHMYSTPLVPSGNHEMELTVAIGKWGETFAASHAQLSLVGWGANQQWDESALGAWGESITYDPDKTLRRAMVDDVRPFLMNVNGQYNWTGNVGGADFLKYVQTSRPWRDQQPTQLKSTYTAPGPVMTDVTYSGITADDAMTLTAQTHLVRTDDLVRAYYVLHYEFLEDVDYARMGLFQIAADNYSDNGFTKYAYGDSTGVLLDATVPNHGTTGYASDADRGIEMTGEHPWVFMYDSNRTGGNLPEHVADVGFVIRDYTAVINGTTIVNPHININRTNNGGWSQMAFELGLPFDPNHTIIEAGSTIDAIVEYLVIPNDISLYYGPSTDIAGVDVNFFGTTDIIELLASENTVDISPFVGSLDQMQPTIITGVTAEIAAHFEMIGGFGYTPVTIQGLFRADGWQLQSLNNGVWEEVDQSVHGNDYWQTRFDESTGTYALTFSVNIDGPTEFRLIHL